MHSTYVRGWPHAVTGGWAKWSGTSFAAPLVAADIANAIKTSHPATANTQDVADDWKRTLPEEITWPGKLRGQEKPRKFMPSPKLSDG
jgi:hypothetical protein